MRRNTGKLSITLLMTLIVLSMTVSNVSAVPQPPHRFSGSVTIDGEAAPDGTLIEVKIDEVTYADTTTVDGKYGYIPDIFDVPADDPATTTTKEGGVNGDALDFYVAGTLADSSTFESGKYTVLDLSITSPEDTDPPVISAITVSSIKTNKATISWTTDEPATCYVEYGLTLSHGSTSTPTSLGTSHSVTLTGLTAKTIYHYWIVATDAADNTAHSIDKTFTTASSGGGGGGGGTINESPVADAGSNRIAFVGKAINFNGSGSSDPDGTITEYAWAFGDGASGTGASPSHSYSAKGKYTVTLTVTDDNDATDTDSITVKVEALPASTKNETETNIKGAQTNFIIDDTSTIGAKVRLNTTGDVNIALVEYATNPYPDAPKPKNMLSKYIDIFVDDPDSVAWPIYIEVHYTNTQISGLDESTFALYYYANGAWNLCSNTGVDTANNFVWAYLTRVEAAGSPLTIGKMPTAAQFKLSSLSVTPAQVNIGASIAVQVSVANIGDLEGSTTVDLYINAVKEQSKPVTLAGGASTTVLFSVTKTTAGSYTVKVGDLTGSLTVVKPLTPAAFTFSSLTLSPADVEPKGEVTVSVKVENTGEQPGTYSAELKLDGASKETKTGTLAGGATATVTFKVSSQVEGKHTVQVGDQTGSFTATTPPPDYTIWYTIGAVVIVAVVIAAYLLMKRKPKPNA